MSSSTSVGQRLEFLKIDDSTRAALAEFRPVIETAVPASLKTFYSQVRRYPEVRSFFKDESHIDHAANAQEGLHHHRRSGEAGGCLLREQPD